jgi:chromosome segregation ATPase
LTPGEVQGFFLPGGTYFQDDMTTTSKKITLQVAAKALDISVRTVQRYLDKGLITKIKEDAKVYVYADEIRGLRKRLEATNDTTDDMAKSVKTTVTVDMSYLEGLLVQIGEMKEKQRLLLEYKDDIRQREVSLLAKEQELTQTKAALAANSAELDQAKAAITKARSELQRLLEIQQNAEQKAKMVIDQQAALEAKERELAEIRAEVERLKKPFWKRIFKR